MSDQAERVALTSVAMATPQSPARTRFALRSPREALQPAAAPAPPPRRRRRSGLLGRISGILSLLVFVSAVTGGLAVYVTSEIHAPGPLQSDKVVLIPKNSSSGDIVELLTREGVIDHPTLTAAWIVIHQQRLKAGEYLFRKEASIADAVQTLENGKPITYKFSVPEGLTSEQVVDRLNENDVLSGTIRDVPREGTLLPDTYVFERGYSREHILRDMRAAQEKLLKDIWARRAPDLPLKTPQELVTLASIVEKETGKPDERARVAAVFINRLNRDMRLQTDPTVIYGLVGGKGGLGRGLTRAELDTPTPYNTYTIKGLPPGPIANPGKAALEATANPAKTNDLYFVADGSGGHAFAETRIQHERNVARWRQIENQAPTQSAPTQVPSVQTPGSQNPASLAPQPVAPLAAPPSYPVPKLPNQRGALPGPQSPIGLAPRTLPHLPPVKSGLNALPLPGAPRLAANPRPLPGSSFFAGGAVKVEIATLDHDPLADEEDVAGLAPENFGDAASASGTVESYPVPANRRTGIRATGVPHEVAAETPAPAPALAFSSGEPSVRPKAFDAVEGTDKDPLRNKTFDLNSPKTIPALR